MDSGKAPQDEDVAQEQGPEEERERTPKPGKGTGERLSGDELINEFGRIYTKLKKKHKERGLAQKVTDALNDAGILPKKAEKWSYQTTKKFMDDHKDHFEERFAEKPEKQKPTPTVKKEKNDTPPPPTKPTPGLVLDDHYPWFRKGERIQQTYRISKELIERAREKQSMDVPRSGDTMPKLIELLLWQYLGCPEDLVWTSQKKKE